MLNFVICDDNLHIVDKLEKMLNDILVKYSDGAKVVFTSDNTDDLLKFSDENKVDVFLLDINFKTNRNGLNVAETIRKRNKNAYIIFTTGHMEYVLMAYKYKTFDYLTKPITPDRLEETIKRLFDDINGMPKKYLRIDNKNTLIDESEIEYIKRDGMKLVFHTASRDYDIYSSFNKFQDKLPKNFIRCHKSFVVNINQINDVDPVTGVITLKDNNSCYIGPKYKSEFMEVLNNYGIF